MGLLDNEGHVETLGENLREEMGEVSPFLTSEGGLVFRPVYFWNVSQSADCRSLPAVYAFSTHVVRCVLVLTPPPPFYPRKYDEGTLLACEALGIRRESVQGVPHRELFRGLVEFLETVLQRSYSRFIPKDICEKLNQAIDYARGCGRLGLLSVLYFGSELIVPDVYSSILQGLRNSIDVSNEDARFLLLHIDMDQDHAQALREIIVENCRTKAARVVLAQCAKMLLDARVTFYDLLIRYTSLDPMSRGLDRVESDVPSVHDEIGMLKEPYPVCMSDFTGRPVVFEMCKAHVRGSTVLDVGCGAGQVARQLVEQGATKIVGVDISRTMVVAANLHPEKNQHAEYYVEGNASNLKATLLKTTKKTNLMPGAQFDVGLFDLSVAVFVFNYLTITDMDKSFKDIFALLKPGGYFVFSVPHPFTSSHGKTTKQ
jgi:SAM-dependent methyltransferase